MYLLIIIDEDGGSVEVPFIRNEITIGRKVGNTIRLAERNISRRHARLYREKDAIWVEDLESYNGVYLNGERIKDKTSIRLRDLLEIGDYQIQLDEFEDSRDRIELNDMELERTRELLLSGEAIEAPEFPAELRSSPPPSPLELNPEDRHEPPSEEEAEEAHPWVPVRGEQRYQKRFSVGELWEIANRVAERKRIKQALLEEMEPSDAPDADSEPLPDETPDRDTFEGSEPEPFEERAVTEPELPVQPGPGESETAEDRREIEEDATPEPVPEDRPETPSATEPEEDPERSVTQPQFPAIREPVPPEPDPAAEPPESDATETEAPAPADDVPAASPKESSLLGDVLHPDYRPEELESYEEALFEPEKNEPAPEIVRPRISSGEDYSEFEEDENLFPKPARNRGFTFFLLLILFGVVLLYSLNEMGYVSLSGDPLPAGKTTKGPIPPKEMEKTATPETAVAPKTGTEAAAVEEIEPPPAEEPERPLTEEERKALDQFVKTSIRSAGRFFKHQRWADAGKVLDNALHEAPNHPELVKMKARAQMEKEAMQAYQNGLKALSENNYFLVLTLFEEVGPESHYYKKARKYLSAAKKKAPAYYTDVARKLDENGKHREALYHAERALDIDEKYTPALKLKARILERVREE